MANTPAPTDLRASVIDRFTRIASAPEQERTFPVGAESALGLGYDAAEIDALPGSVTESFCGVGNPLSLGEPRPGQTVLDMGCGAGLDTLLAARRVGPSGRAIGVDMTREMIIKARRNAGLLGLPDAAWIQGDLAHLPLPDSSVDLVISNGVLNLCPDKFKILSEAFRVLRPGGRLQMADILLEPQVTPEEVATRGSWSD